MCGVPRLWMLDVSSLGRHAIGHELDMGSRSSSKNVLCGFLYQCWGAGDLGFRFQGHAIDGQGLAFVSERGQADAIRATQFQCLLLCPISMFAAVSCLLLIVMHRISQHLRLWLQADNTPKEVRNQYTSQLCCLLCQANTFSVTGHHHLGVGHTHEDVDGILSLVTTSLRQESVLQCPPDVVKCLEKRLCPLFSKRGMQFGVEVVDEVTCLFQGFNLSFRTAAMFAHVAPSSLSLPHPS